VRGKLVSRGQAKRADYILYFKPNIPIALIEAKDNTHGIGDGMQQGLEYATTLAIPFRLSRESQPSANPCRGRPVSINDFASDCF
jgi:type I restriction enzyme R subunit